MWAAARWAHTYLLPDDPVSQAMHDRYGATPAGSATADQLVQIAGALLMGLPDTHVGIPAGLLSIIAGTTGLVVYSSVSLQLTWTLEKPRSF